MNPWTWKTLKVIPDFKMPAPKNMQTYARELIARPNQPLQNISIGIKERGSMALNAEYAPPELSTATKHQHHAARAPQAKPAAMAPPPASNAAPQELFTTACRAARSAQLDHTAKPAPAAVPCVRLANGACQALPNALRLQKVKCLHYLVLLELDIIVQKYHAL